MNVIYKKSFKRIVLTCCSMLALVSCSDWTETETVDLYYPTLENENPGLYESYLSALKEYKLNEHKVTIAKFDNKSTLPGGQADHISTLPDSIDYVILNNADNLHETTIREMEDIRRKGTSTLYSIDYAVIEKEYQLMLEQEAANAPEVTDENTDGQEEEADRFIAFCQQRMDQYLSLYNQYGYDGVNVIYNGVFPLSLPQAEKAKLEARQNAFFGKVKAWLDANGNAVLLFEGKPQNLLSDKSILKAAKYIIIPVVDAKSASEILFTTEMAITNGVPTDRFVFGVTTPSLSEEDKTKGYFTATDENGNKVTTILGSANMVVSNSGSFTKAGICIDNAQNDYYNIQKIYKNIREAISCINPSI